MHTETFHNFLRFEKRYSAHTVQAYLADVNTFLEFMANTYELADPEKVTHQHIRSWMVTLMESGVSARSVNRKLSSLRAYFRLLQKRSLVSVSPLNRVQPPRSGRRLPVVVEQNHLVQVLETGTLPDDFAQARDLMVVALLYGLGLRRAELISVRLQDFDLRQGIVRITGKGQKQRVIPYGSGLADLLRQYIAVRKCLEPVHEELILTDRGRPAYPKLIYSIVRRFLSLSGTTERKSPHVLRHSFATHMAEAGAGIEVIRELLGHSSIASTQVYTQTSVERLKKTYRQAHPKA